MSPARPHRLDVAVDAPHVRGGTVRFSWTQTSPNRLQYRNRWSVRYHRVPLRRLHRVVLWEVLLSLQLPVWARMAEHVEIALPEPVPRVVIDWWRAYHDAPHVRFTGPLTEERSYRPVRGDAGGSDADGSGADGSGAEVAITYGGGKDTTLALHALLEQREPSRVLLLHLVQLFNDRRSHRVRLTLRSLRTVLRPARRLTGVPTQLVTVDFLGTLRKGPAAPGPHVTLYFSAMLPALLHHGVRAVTVSRTAAGYRVGRTRDGTPHWANPSGRPERLQALRASHRHVPGVELAAESTHYALGELVSFGSLLRLYPRAFDRIVMCMRTERPGRWCHNCSKCLEFALFGLALGHVADDLDYDRLLASPHVTALVDAARRRVTKTAWHGNAPYARLAGTASHFAGFCHALHQLDPADPALLVSATARKRLRLLKRTWGRVAFPAVASLDAAAVQAAGPLGQEVAAAASTVFPVAERGEEVFALVGDARAEFAHGGVMELPRLQQWAAEWGVELSG